VEKMRAEAKEMRYGGGDARRGGEVWSCRHRAGRTVPRSRHGPGRRPMTRTALRVVPARARCRSCRAAHGSCQNVVSWAVPPAHGPFVHLCLPKESEWGYIAHGYPICCFLMIVCCLHMLLKEVGSD
jgi:hypothetical protein